MKTIETLSSPSGHPSRRHHYFGDVSFCFKSMTNNAKTIILLLAILLGYSTRLMAQGDSTSLRPTFSLDATTEIQTDCEIAKWANLLELHATIPISRKFKFDIGTLSFYTNDEEGLLEDMQIFSNLDALNVAFALSTAGFTWQINDRHSLFAGIRRIDEDYFCSDALSVFTNSSCGGFPTLTGNYTMPTYPVSAMGLHYVYDHKNVTFQASLYNGFAHQDLTGRYNVFRVCPKTDGVFALTQVEYRHGDSHYYLGGSLYHGDFTLEGVERITRPSIWTLAEQALSPDLTLLAAYSHAFSDDEVFNHFAGIGLRYVLGRAEFGIFSDFVHYDNLDLDIATDGYEFATELTCKVHLTDWFSIQPVVHIINTDGDGLCAGVLRLNVSL